MQGKGRLQCSRAAVPEAFNFMMIARSSFQADTPYHMADALWRSRVGEDAAGASYFLQASSREDCRLHRGTPLRDADGVDHNFESWTTACTSLEDVRSLQQRLARSDSAAEKSLAARLEERLLSCLEERSPGLTSGDMPNATTSQVNLTDNPKL